MTTFPIPHNYANHILVTSPSPVVRQRVLESLLSPVRCFEQACGGAEALVHLESGFWQVLFLDRRLPDLDAEELSQTVRQRFPGIDVALLDSEIDPALGPVLDQTNDLPSDLLVGGRGSAPSRRARLTVGGVTADLGFVLRRIALCQTFSSH